MITEFQTISSRSESAYKEKGSKFIGIALPVSKVVEVKGCLDEIRRQYHDARHHCYAYMLGHNQSEFRANDDGEPNHSAGYPILGQIRANQLTNILIVVVRYFGGTKLGASGLINAYKTAAGAAIDNSKIVVSKVTSRVNLNYDYNNTNDVMRLIDDFKLKILSQKFETTCSIEADVIIDRVNELKARTALLNSTGSRIELEFSESSPRS